MSWRGAGLGALGLVAVAAAQLAAQAPAAVSTAGELEARTAAWFDAARAEPQRLLMFLREMPKGGDLHSHLSGAVYAESYVRWAAEDGLCVDTSTGAYVQPPCDAAAGRPPAAQALTDGALHDFIVDAQSVRNWHPARRSGHEQMFGAFERFRAISQRTGDMLAEVATRAVAGRVSYLELMLTPGGGAVTGLARAIGWDADLERLRTRLLAAGLRDSLDAGRRQLDAAEARQRELLGCGTAAAHPACSVVVRYQYQGQRARPPEQVFALFLAGFELASTDPRVVGINFVQPEDHVVALRDFTLHMQMLELLRRHYPGVRLTLHAGELRSGLVPPEALRFHIRSSIEQGGAQRIGHGTSIAHEDGADALLRDMAQRGVLVEVALSSNDYILGVTGRDHPLRLYLSYGVPVALVTDDEGVLRTELTMEYLRAADEHDVGYLDLKRMARNSLQYAFVEGESLWSDVRDARPAAACANGYDTASCRQLLEASTRARLQLQLERDFAALERRYGAGGAWTAP